MRSASCKWNDWWTEEDSVNVASEAGGDGEVSWRWKLLPVTDAGVVGETVVEFIRFCGVSYFTISRGTLNSLSEALGTFGWRKKELFPIELLPPELFFRGWRKNELDERTVEWLLISSEEDCEDSLQLQLAELASDVVGFVLFDVKLELPESSWQASGWMIKLSSPQLLFPCFASNEAICTVLIY